MNVTILFVDNDTHFLKTRCEYLKNAGYTMIAASCIEDAWNAIDGGHIDLMITDIRLRDDDDDKDISGILLSKKAPRDIPKIIITNFPNTKNTVEALKPQSDGKALAVDFLEKQHGPEPMLQSIKEAISQYSQMNWDLEIAWIDSEQLSFDTIVRSIEPGLDAILISDRSNELEKLLRKLHHNMSKIELGPVLWGREERLCLQATLYSLDEMAVQGKITFGLKPRAQREKIIFERLPEHAKSAITLHYAAISYTLSGRAYPGKNSS